MDLTTLDTVAMILNLQKNDNKDNLLKKIIPAVSQEVENRMNRHAERKQRTETLDVPFSTRRVFLKGYPISQIGYVWNDSTRKFGLNDDTVSTTVDDDSAKDQKVLKVASTTDFAVDDFVAIDQGGDRDEVQEVASIAAGDSLTMKENLVYPHTQAQGDAVIVSPVDAQSVIDSDLYTFESYGMVWFDFVLAEGANALKITYTGGMDTTAELFEENFAGLSYAVAKQVVFEFEGRKRIGLRARTGRGSTESRLVPFGSDAWLSDFGNLIPDLVSKILKYKRRTG